MPEPGDLRMHQADGRCAITAGSVVLFEYDADDIVMRNMVLAALRQLGFPGRAVARVLGLTESYVSTLFSAAKRDGSAALVSQPRRGRPGTVSGRQWELAREWRAADVSDAEIGRRLGVAHTTIGRGLGQREQAARQQAPAPLQAEPLFTDRGAAPGADAEPDAAQAGPGPEPEAGPGPEPDAEPEPAGEPQAGPGRAWPVIGEGVFASRHAGAMLLHAFFARADAGAVLASGAGRPRQEVALLSAVSMCFALGAATIEQFKHLAAADAGPLAGLAGLSGLRTLRARRAASAACTR